MDLSSYLRDCGLAILTDPEKGKGLYCERHFEAGSALLSVEAFATCSLKSWNHRCVSCLKSKRDAPDTFFVCTSCNLAAFCSRECEERDRWHSWECVAFPDAAYACGFGRSGNMVAEGVGLFSNLMMLARFLRTIHGFPCTESCMSASPESFTAKDFASYLRTMALGVEEQARVISKQEYGIAVTLITMDKRQVLLPPVFHTKYNTEPEALIKDIVICYRQMRNNNFLMVDAAFNIVAACLDPMTALINHSCEPNAALIWRCPTTKDCPTTHVVRSLQALKPGDEVLISYIDSNAPWWMRQQKLTESFNFVCNCSLCSQVAQYKQALFTDSPVPEPDDIFDSKARLFDAQGKVITMTVQGTAGLCRYLQAELGVVAVPSPREQIDEVSAAVSIVTELASKEVTELHELALSECSRRLSLLRGPARILIRLLSPTHVLLSVLARVMYLAERCSDWDECLFLAPHVLGALVPSRAGRLSLGFVDALALQSIAQLMLRTSGRGTGVATHEAPMSQEDGLSLVGDPLVRLKLLYGSFVEDHPRVKTIRSILHQMKSHSVWLDSMD